MQQTLYVRKKFMLLSVLALMMFCFSGMMVPLDAKSADGGKQAAGKADVQLLAGQWLRPDGGYVLQLSNIMKDGSMKAAYFNPKPINVSRAEWKNKDGAIAVFVELRDVNYPGSTYTLLYDPASDLLTGIYYQAAMKQQFEVEFVRRK